jgi:hypothetical protein
VQGADAAAYAKHEQEVRGTTIQLADCVGALDPDQLRRALEEAEVAGMVMLKEGASKEYGADRFKHVTGRQLAQKVQQWSVHSGSPKVLCSQLVRADMEARVATACCEALRVARCGTGEHVALLLAVWRAAVGLHQRQPTASPEPVSLKVAYEALQREVVQPVPDGGDNGAGGSLENARQQLLASVQALGTDQLKLALREAEEAGMMLLREEKSDVTGRFMHVHAMGAGDWRVNPTFFSGPSLRSTGVDERRVAAACAWLHSVRCSTAGHTALLLALSRGAAGLHQSQHTALPEPVAVRPITEAYDALRLEIVRQVPDGGAHEARVRLETAMWQVHDSLEALGPAELEQAVQDAGNAGMALLERKGSNSFQYVTCNSAGLSYVAAPQLGKMLLQGSMDAGMAANFCEVLRRARCATDRRAALLLALCTGAADLHLSQAAPSPEPSDRVSLDAAREALREELHELPVEGGEGCGDAGEEGDSGGGSGCGDAGGEGDGGTTASTRVQRVQALTLQLAASVARLDSAELNKAVTEVGVREMAVCKYFGRAIFLGVKHNPSSTGEGYWMVTVPRAHFRSAKAQGLVSSELVEASALALELRWLPPERRFRTMWHAALALALWLLAVGIPLVQPVSEDRICHRIGRLHLLREEGAHAISWVRVSRYNSHFGGFRAEMPNSWYCPLLDAICAAEPLPAPPDGMASSTAPDGRPFSTAAGRPHPVMLSWICCFLAGGLRKQVRGQPLTPGAVDAINLLVHLLYDERAAWAPTVELPHSALRAVRRYPMLMLSSLFQLCTNWHFGLVALAIAVLLVEHGRVQVTDCRGFKRLIKNVHARLYNTTPNHVAGFRGEGQRPLIASEFDEERL